MATLAELKNGVVRDAFVKKTVDTSSASQMEPAVLNSGLKTTAQLIEAIKKGDSIPFDYNRLVEESKKYE